MSSAHSSSSDDSTSSINSISADGSAAAVPSTSAARPIHLISTRPSTSSMLLMFADHSSSPMLPMFPDHSSSPMLPIFPDNSSSPMDLMIAENYTLPITELLTAVISMAPSSWCEIRENYDDFRFEAARLWSFRNWPRLFIHPTSLAAAGFYSTGEIDRVRCFECQVEISHWAQGQLPMQIHIMCSPKCRFIRNEHCDNVPIGANPDRILRRKRRNISCPYGLKYQDSFDFHDHIFSKFSRTLSSYELSRLGLRKVKEPKKLEYASYESRLNSFARWPAYIRQKSEELAHAGFYYTKIKDFTTCFHCGISIRNWRPQEDPLEQHAILSPGCYYLLTIEGFKYANNVTDQELYETSTEIPTQISYGIPKRSNSENDTNEMTLVQKIAAAKEKNRALKNARLCKVCMEREATVVFLPCGHVATCDYCSPALTKCIICRGELKATSSAIFL
ncbi:E3 ubiquitin-protein ligase XIAP-like isoform X4 [Bombus affinis]|uniref:E3 ubiquitin-protein ligase XIAP-like isoform X3 n=1 Tax=Bombus affinis TaxID=309941 RepID=UPI0021B81530|nr:E3 ubiquitin-protein ligase XIAP-like isoform X3 [Bombus affinis]XP_050584344.1 E3 ubiquitin-protein ligase XIAP-like isoform X4 [Bombus affinis]